MAIEFIDYGEFLASTDSKACINKDTISAVWISGSLDIDELEQILSKMKELQGENHAI